MSIRWKFASTLRRFVLVAALGTLSVGAIASEASAKSSYCSPSGDFCLSTRVNADNNGVAEIRTFFSGKYKLCVTDPTKDVTCDSFKLRKKGSIYKSVVEYQAEFGGTHKVRWFLGGRQLGRSLTFKIEASAPPGPGVYFFNARQGYLLSPDRLDFCSSGCEYDGLTWTGWGTPTATGTGFFAPVVSGQVVGRYPVTITLSELKTCSDGITIYSRYDETLTGELPPFPGVQRTSTTWWGCDGQQTS